MVNRESRRALARRSGVQVVAALMAPLFVFGGGIASAAIEPVAAERVDSERGRFAVDGALAAHDLSGLDTADASTAAASAAGPTAIALDARREAVGDVMGWGFDQRVTITDDGIVKVMEPEQRGGRVVREFKAAVNHGVPFTGFLNKQLMWDSHTQGPKIAVGNRHIFVSEYHYTPYPQMDIGFKVTAYSFDGKAFRTFEARDKRVVTAMTVGVVNGEEVLAVGYSQHGFELRRTKDLTLARKVYADWGEHLVTALGIGDLGDGRTGVLVGRITTTQSSRVMWNAAANETLWETDRRYPSLPVRFPHAFAFGKLDTTGKQYVASAYNQGGPTVEIGDPLTGEYITGLEVGPAHGLAFVQDMHGERMLAAAGSPDWGRVFRFDPAGRKFLEVPVAPDGGVQTSKVDLSAWLPGYADLDVAVQNTTSTDVDVHFSWSADPALGCWANAMPVTGKPGLPADAMRLGARKQSEPLRTGFLTAGSKGDCVDAEKSFYVSVSESGRAGGGRQVAKLKAVDGQLVVDQVIGQVGEGRYTVAVTPNGTHGLRLGSWTLSVSERSQATALTAPRVTGTRLTAEPGANPKAGPDDPRRPVYRFDVDGAQWTVPGASAGLAEAVLPPLTVEGSTDGTSWDRLGELTPTTTPTLSGETLTLGAASFYWQNQEHGPAYTKIRVLTDDAKPSQEQLFDTLKAPAAETNSDVLTLKPLQGENATPRANGIDQAPLRLTVNLGGESGPSAGGDDPRYNLVYYRDNTTKALVTGLSNPAAFGQAIAVNAVRGAFPNDGQPAAAAEHELRVFLTTTSTATHEVSAVTNLAGTGVVKSSKVLKTMARMHPATTDGGGTTGITAGGAALANPNQGPVPFQAGTTQTGAALGVQFRALATTGSASLPMFTETSGQIPEGAHLTSVGMQIDRTRATVDPRKFSYPAETFSGAVIANGDRLPIVNAPVER